MLVVGRCGCVISKTHCSVIREGGVRFLSILAKDKCETNYTINIIDKWVKNYMQTDE